LRHSQYFLPTKCEQPHSKVCTIGRHIVNYFCLCLWVAYYSSGLCSNKVGERRNESEIFSASIAIMSLNFDSLRVESDPILRQSVIQCLVHLACLTFQRDVAGWLNHTL
jgi:hypothetical protein